MNARIHTAKSLTSGSFFEKVHTVASTKWAKGTVFASIALMSLLYVVQMNMTATKGYEIRELERSIAVLEKESKTLKMQSLELQSMDRVVSQLANAQLVKARPDGFINPAASAVATR
jgi:cell division protein FtsL